MKRYPLPDSAGPLLFSSFSCCLVLSVVASIIKRVQGRPPANRADDRKYRSKQSSLSPHISKKLKQQTTTVLSRLFIIAQDKST